MVEETSNNVDPSKMSNFDRYVHASKMQPQSSGSLRSNAGAEKGKEIAAKLNIHRVHGQLRGLDTTGRLQNISISLAFVNVKFSKIEHVPLNSTAIWHYKEEKVLLQWGI